MGMRGKSDMVELYCFVVHAQHNASRMIERELLGKELSEQRAYRRLEHDREPARRQDREDSGRDMEAEGREGSNGRTRTSERLRIQQGGLKKGTNSSTCIGLVDRFKVWSLARNSC